MNSDTTVPPAATTPESKKHNKLELPQQFRLLDWCRQNEEKVKSLTDPQLAQIAQAELGFTITTPNLASVRNAAGIEKLKPTAPPTVEERLQRLETALVTFITWSQVELGESGVLALLKVLSTNTAVPPPPPSPPLTVSESPSLPTLPGLETIPLSQSPA